MLLLFNYNLPCLGAEMPEQSIEVLSAPNAGKSVAATCPAWLLSRSLCCVGPHLSLTIIAKSLPNQSLSRTSCFTYRYFCNRGSTPTPRPNPKVRKIHPKLQCFSAILVTFLGKCFLRPWDWLGVGVDA
eukprot:5849885-Amphidinium_carterae.1